jgi:hypothetical protein
MIVGVENVKLKNMERELDSRRHKQIHRDGSASPTVRIIIL